MLTNMTTEERERLAYAEGFTEAAGVLAALSDAEGVRDSLIEQIADIPSEKERDKDAQDLQHLKEFFYACFNSLAAHYPCPSWSSDYDKSVIFDAIRKSEGMDK